MARRKQPARNTKEGDKDEYYKNLLKGNHGRDELPSVGKRTYTRKTESPKIQLKKGETKSPIKKKLLNPAEAPSDGY